MTKHVRKSYRNHRKTTWAVVLVVLASAALALVLPALAINTSGGGVLPASRQGVTPSILSLGGSNFSCASAGQLNYGNPGLPAGMRQFQISKPTPGSYTDPATGVTFVISGPTGGQDPTSYFSFRVRDNAAAVYHVGLKGGTKIAWYDYFNNAPGGVFSDDNLHSTPDSKYDATTNPPKFTFFVASITTFCYKPATDLTVTPSCGSPFPGHKLGGTGGAVLFEAQLVLKNGLCKTDNVVMYSFTPDTNKLFATLNPVAPGGTAYEVVEHIQWTGISGDSQNPIKLDYDDTAPYNGVDTASNNINGGTNDGWRVMKLCGSDPRPNPGQPFDLGGNHPALPAEPLPGPEGPHSTCMLQSTDSAGTGPNARRFDAWLYSTVDGARNGG